uniref:Secreted protein n=1 Tax=Anopheles epiroticus TaxID=199890 RepID=A0A182P530_9DIPT
MIRPILPILAYMSVLSSTYSLHMARDAYIKPPPPPPPASQLLDDLDDMSELLAENGVDLMRPMMGTVHQKAHAGTTGGGGVGGGGGGGSGSIISIGSAGGGGSVALGTINHMTSNELPELSPPPAHLPSGLRHGPIGPLVGQPPRGLQELFGVQTNFDIRAAQQQLSHGPNDRASASFDQSSASGMDDRDDDNGGGGEDSNRAGGQDGDQGNGNLQRSAASNKRASPTGGRNKMMADSAQDGGGSSSGLPSIPHGIANQMMLRSTRGQRQYDVPQIGK